MLRFQILSTRVSARSRSPIAIKRPSHLPHHLRRKRRLSQKRSIIQNQDVPLTRRPCNRNRRIAHQPFSNRRHLPLIRPRNNPLRIPPHNLFEIDAVVPDNPMLRRNVHAAQKRHDILKQSLAPIRVVPAQSQNPRRPHARRGLRRPQCPRRIHLRTKSRRLACRRPIVPRQIPHERQRRFSISSRVCSIVCIRNTATPDPRARLV